MVRVWIEGFRAFSKPIELELEPVTIVTGRNNSGKSSLLEAIAIASSARARFRDAMGRDVIEAIASAKGFPLEYFVNLDSHRAAIEVNGCRVEILKNSVSEREALELLLRSYAEALANLGREIQGYIARREITRAFLTALRVRGLAVEVELPGISKEVTAFLARLFATILTSNPVARERDLASALCLSLPIESSEVLTCGRVLRPQVTSLEEAYRVLMDATINEFMKRVAEIIVTYIEGSRKCISIYTTRSPSKLLRESPRLIDAVDEFASRLRRLVIEVASISGVSEVTSRVKSLDIVGSLSEVLKDFAWRIVEAIPSAMERAKQHFEACIEKSSLSGFETIFAMHRGSWSLGDLGELLDRVFHAGYRKMLIEFLSGIGVDDVWRDKSGELYAAIEGDRLPMSALGDGVLNLVRLTAIHSLVNRGFVIVEEPETAMHPGYLALYANLVLNHASRGGVTIVISTHSHEFIDYVLELARDRKALDRVAIVHLYRGSEGIEVSTYSGEEAIERRKELYEDLRGL